MPTKISVLVCTRNRPDDIEYALKAILANQYPDFDVVIVDQSEDNETRDRIAGVPGAAERVTYIHTTIKGKSNAINHGVTECTGDILALTDDDCEPPKNWLSRIAASFAKHSDVGIIYGQVHEPEDLPDEDAHVPCLYFFKGRYLKKGEFYGMGANMSVRKNLIQLANGFDALLGPGGKFSAAEEPDFMYRAQRAGVRVYVDHKIVLVHKAWRNTKEWQTVLRAYGLGDAAFYMKHARCGDAWGWRMVVKRLAWHSFRTVVNGVLRRQTGAPEYLNGFWQGIQQSKELPLDHEKRLYVNAVPAAQPVELVSQAER